MNWIEHHRWLSWGVGVLLGCLWLAFRVGRGELEDDGGEGGFFHVVLSIIWPITIACVLVALPFVGLAKLGQKTRSYTDESGEKQSPWELVPGRSRTVTTPWRRRARLQRLHRVRDDHRVQRWFNAD